MKHAKAEATPPAEVIDSVYQDAVAISAATRSRVRFELGDDCVFDRPDAEWEELLAERATLPARLDAAARTLPRLADEAMRPFVRRAARNLVAAVLALARWRPEHRARSYTVAEGEFTRAIGLAGTFDTWEPTAESVARLDEIRATVRVRLIELAELFEPHADGLSRMLAVARRVAEVVLEPTDAGIVSAWLVKLEAGDGGQAVA